MSASLATLNPFASSQVNRETSDALAHTDQQRAIAEVQAAMLIARANPRDPVRAMDRILNACQRPTLAEAAIYSYSRGGADVSGPSIRLAETLAQSWGNLSYGLRELSQDGGESTVQAYAWDVETNTRREMVFQVPHVRHTKAGQKKLEDPRDIYEIVANQGARRLRACILAIIPGDVTEAAVEQCDRTMREKADTSPEAVKRILEAFAKYGVSREQIEARIQRRIDSIQPAQVVSLKKVYASLRDGMSTPADWFTESVPSAAVVDLNTRLRQETAPPAKPVSAPTPEATTTEPHEPPPAVEPTASEWPKADAHGELVDARGIPWIAGCHSGAKSCNADGTWRRMKGAQQSIIEQREAAALAERATAQHSDGPDAAQAEAPAITSDVIADLFAQVQFDADDQAEWMEHNFPGVTMENADAEIFAEMAQKLNELLV
jgi:hypothetical protein